MKNDHTSIGLDARENRANNLLIIELDLMDGGDKILLATFNLAAIYKDQQFSEDCKRALIAHVRRMVEANGGTVKQVYQVHEHESN